MGKITEYGCIGEHLGHSFSKEIHAAIGDYSYETEEIAPVDLQAFLQAKAFLGINVTIPYKEAVIPYLDGIDPAAQAIGAVNTIVRREGKLWGYNTDFYGLSALLDRVGIELAGQTVCILGTGGTGKTACEVARVRGAKQIVRVSRTAKENAVSYREAATVYNGAQVILNTTPCGMFPQTNCAPLSLQPFEHLRGVADCIYHPLRSLLVQEAQARGLPAAGGLFMLVAQAVRASELFFHTSYPPAFAETVYRRIVADKENIVLIGMPGCGKTTVGKRLAQKLGYAFLDTDAEIEKEQGCSIAAIFRRQGEEAFRAMETAVLAQTENRHRTVIATGGGAVLRAENLRILKKNGRLYFLDRPLKALLPTSDRPTAANAEAMEARYRERYPLYCACADERIALSDTATVEEAANAVCERREKTQ